MGETDRQRRRERQIDRWGEKHNIERERGRHTDRRAETERLKKRER